MEKLFWQPIFMQTVWLIGHWSNLGNPMEFRNHRFIRRIRMTEAKDALRRMKIGKSMGLDEISIEVWKCLGDVGTCMLVNKHFQ